MPTCTAPLLPPPASLHAVHGPPQAHSPDPGACSPSRAGTPVAAVPIPVPAGRAAGRADGRADGSPGTLRLSGGTCGRVPVARRAADRPALLGCRPPPSPLGTARPVASYRPAHRDHGEHHDGRDEHAEHGVEHGGVPPDGDESGPSEAHHSEARDDEGASQPCGILST